MGCPCELLDRLLVVAEVGLAADQEDGQAGAKVEDLRDPLLLHVIKRVGRVDCEADEDDVRVRVGEWSQSVVVLLARPIFVNALLF